MRNIFLLFVLLPACIFAQVSDDFSDGDFTQDPAWSGDAGHFKVSMSTAIPEEQRPALQLDAPAAGISALSAGKLSGNDLEWHFWIKISLNTSAGNFARVYLLSDNAELTGPLHGYYLQAGGSDDNVTFCRQDSIDAIPLLPLNSLFTGNSTNSFRFVIFRSADGDWKFFADSLGGQSFAFRGEINDMSVPGGEYTGFFCQYTSSNTTKFYFDDFYAGPRIIDSIPPILTGAEAVCPDEIILSFSEPLDKESAEYPLNYNVSPDLGFPVSAARQPDPSIVHLYFEFKMQNGAGYLLNVSSVKDQAGNESTPANYIVRYYQVMPYDLVFSEIMADPAPSLGLPEHEYLEIHNRSEYPLNLDGMALFLSSTGHVLPDFVIGSGEYILLCDIDAVPLMSMIGDVIGLSSFTLPNNGAALHLLDTAGQTICYLDYDLSWYNDAAKSDGGWSLEMIDIHNPCKNATNWTSSVDYTGGTPGRENSAAIIPDEEIEIIKSCCINPMELEVEFSESLDSLTASDSTRYLAEPFLGHPSLVTPVSPDFRSLILSFREEFSTQNIYQITIHPGLKNCTGEEIPATFQSFFARPQALQPFDIIISEALFNPLGDGVDYIELYNRSEKAIDLQDLFLASVKYSPPNPPDTQIARIASSCSVMLPSAYLVLTGDPRAVKDQYYCPDPDAFLQVQSFPSYNNDQGYVVLLNKENMVSDGMHYNEDMHFLMLNSTEGVSLERICQDRFGDDPGNWHSAAETTGFGTPGYENSQNLDIVVDEAAVSVQPEVFSPDGDANDDQMGIVYHFDSPGKLITVLIFSTEGRLVRNLVNNEMPGTQGSYSWDGTMDDCTPARNGIYIVYTEVLGIDGKTLHFKNACVLARNR